MDAVTPKPRHDTPDTHSHVVAPRRDGMEKDRFRRSVRSKACVRQGERACHRADAVLRPVRFCPITSMFGSNRPMCSKASFCDKEGRRKADGQIRRIRLARSRQPHVAWTPEGGLDARHVPGANKFYEKGRPGDRPFRHRLGRTVGTRVQGVIMLRKLMLGGRGRSRS